MLLLLFLLNAIIPTAAIKDGGFAPWCKSDFLESSLETGNREERLLEKGMKCRQSYDFPGVSSSSAASICAKKSPFLVDSATAKEGIVTCVWTRTGDCNEGHYIHKYCYKLVPKCTGSWKLYRMDNSEESRWLALHFSHLKVAKVVVPRSQKIMNKKYSRGVLLPITDEESKSLEKVAVLDRMPAFGANPGDIVYLEKGQEAQSICREKARNEPDTSIEPGGVGGGGPPAPGGTGEGTSEGGVTGGGGVTPPGSVGGGGGVTGDPSGTVGGGGNQPYTEIRAKDGSFVLHILANLYTPKLDANGNIDFKYFHQVCNNIMDGAYAATPYYLNDTLLERKLGEGRYYLPGGRDFISNEMDCDKTRDASDLSKWKMLLHLNHVKNGKNYATVDSIYWRKDLPNKECSDQGRYALAFQEEKAMDVPIFDRLPIICVTGSEPHLPTNVHGTCLRNSEPDPKSGSGCKCKEGFEDVCDLDKLNNTQIRELAQSQEVPKGYVCLKVKCGSKEIHEGPDIDAILLVVDGSASINYMKNGTKYEEDYFDMLRQFVYGGDQWLPKKIRVLILQYSSDKNYTTNFVHYFGKTPKNWNEEQYEAASDAAFTKYIASGTPTYEAIEQMTKYWLAENPQPRKAQMYVITDGNANGKGGVRDADGLPVPPVEFRKQVIQNARDHGIYLKYVTVGKLIKLDLINEDVLDTTNDIIQLENYIVLQKDLPRIITENWCHAVTVEDYHEAAKPPIE